MNNDLKQLDLILELYDLYKNLLTEKQQLYLNYYYNYDLSLAEIASELSCSRSAVSLAIHNAILKLENLEESLGLKRKLDLLKQEADIDDALICKIFM